VGLTAARLRLHRPLAAFVETQKMPVVLTPMAKGMLREDHPCYAGVLFHAGSNRLAAVCREADLVIGIGYDPVEFNYEAWMPEVPLLHVDTSSCDIDPAYGVAGEVCGSLEHSLGYLAGLPALENDWDLEDLAKKKLELFRSLEPRSGRFGPLAVLRALREALPKDGILTSDVGAHTHLIGQYWPTPAPGAFIMTNGWSSMGFAIPAAIAAKLCLPDRACLSVTGDGGFLMMAGELVTARRLGMSIVFVVLADRHLSLIQVKKQWRQSDPYGTRLYDGELLAADRFFGVPVLRAESAEEMMSALARAFEEDGPAIVEAVIDGSDYGGLIPRSYK
jgi:acetolactate synthase-1/2/3 large subunit